MRVVFADSGYWIAILDYKDPLHGIAIALGKQIADNRIVTTQLVVVEVLNHFSNYGAFMRRRSLEWLEGIRGNASTEIVWLSEDDFWRAMELYTSRQDQTWSLTDCASFLAMDERGITEALAYDRDFEQAGYVAMLRNL